MGKESMDNQQFETLLARINQETRLTDKKLEILYTSRGYFSAHQASRIVYAFGISADKIRAIQIMEPRLCQMTSSESRDIMGAFSIHADKVKALEHIKRYICDYQTGNGYENILSSFPFEGDKIRAVNIINTVRSDVADQTPAGGHQGYAALGGLYTQCRPLVPHLYGTIDTQRQSMPGYGKIEIPVQAQPNTVPSQYTSHPSYSYPQGRDYAEDRGYPGNTSFDEYPPQSTGCQGTGTYKY